MLIETILNNCHPVKGFKYRNSRFRYDDKKDGTKDGKEKVIVIDVLPRKNSKGLCSKCKRPCPTYDHQEFREFLFIPLWGYQVILVYQPRRVECKVQGVIIEYLPWASGKSPLTNQLKIYLSKWAKLLSWQEVCDQFRVNWVQVRESVKFVVDYGLKQRDLSGIKAIGVDEVQYRRGHKYLTLVYQIDAGRKRLLWIGKDRKAKTLLKFFRWLGKDRTSLLEAVCSDMWKPYLKVIKKKATNALQILDRFHIMKKFNEAIDEIRREEMSKFAGEKKDSPLYRSRWGLLKKPANWTHTQATKMKDLLNSNLRSIKAFLLREEFQKFWTYSSAVWAGKFLDNWCFVAARSRIKPIKKIVKMLRTHREILLNWFRTKEHLSSGIVEGLNAKVKLTMRKSYGFRKYETLEIVLYHVLGDLPPPPTTHSF